MNTDELAINWQNFAQVLLQLKIAFIIVLCFYCLCITKVKVIFLL